MTGITMQEFEQYSADLSNAASTAATGLASELANNQSLNQQQFTETLAQERHNAIREMQSISQEGK